MIKKTLKGLLINPNAGEIREVSVDGDNILQSMYKLINCNYVEAILLRLQHLPSAPKDDIWVDEEALIYPDNKSTIRIMNINMADTIDIVGSALILGHDDNGDCVDHSLTQEDIDKLSESIIFLD